MISDELFERLKNNERNAYDDLLQLAVEEALRLLPVAHEHISKQAMHLHETSKKFYDENKDLQEHKPLVADTIETVEAENPGMTYEDILKNAEPRIRSTLRLEPGVNNTTRGLKDLDKEIGSL